MTVSTPIVVSVLVATLAVGAGALLVERPSGPLVVAKYATTLQGRTGNQRHNAELALSKLTGAVVAPGAEFSFNKRVGSWSRDAGYRRAPVSYNGTLIDAWGGGVCQTSTTLYNAALAAGMKILERNPHRFAPSYCPPGRDAAVAISGIDMRFRNPYDVPITITGGFEGDRLTVSISALKALPKSKIVTDIRQVEAPREYEIDRGGDNRRVRNAGKTGWEVATYRELGGKREFISHDSYPAMHRVVELR